MKRIAIDEETPDWIDELYILVLSIKSECLGRMIFFGEQSLRRAVAEFLSHYR